MEVSQECEDVYTMDVAEFLNLEFGDDISKLKDAESILNHIKEHENKLERKLVPSTEVCQIGSFTKKAENTLKRIDNLKQKHEKLQASAAKQLEVLKPIKDDFAEQLSAVKYLENTCSYLQWIAHVEEINSSIEDAMKQNVPSHMVTHFKALKQVFGVLQSSSCIHLVEYVEKTMLYWHDILKGKFENDFQKILKSFNWPVLFTNFTATVTQSSDVMNKFSDLFGILCEIQLPDNYQRPTTDKGSIGICPTLLPLQLMFEPLQKRFIYHFMGKKQTNRLDKPEWYLAQVLTWIVDNSLFMDGTVQPVMEKLGLKENAVLELMKNLVHLAVVRLRTDLPALLNDDSLLRHTIDELLLFVRELHNQGYPELYPSPIDVLLTEPCFTRWRTLEHKSALEKMDKILNSETAWKPRYQDEGELDDLRVPECAEVFITLLLTMTERYSHLPDENKVSFMELQLELLDDFRLRLHQLSQYQAQETLRANFCAIINAVYYVITVLNEWSNLPLFLKLYNYLKQEKKDSEKQSEKPSIQVSNSACTNNEEEELDGSVFDEAVALLEHMQKDLLQTLGERVVLDIKAKSRAYRKEKWFCMPTVQDKKLMEVSPLAYPMLDVINSSLHALNESLAKPLFTNVWQYIARELNIYLYEEVVLQNSFSEGGAAQLNFDMTRNLFPIFGSYTLKPENYFKLIKESCVLLNLNRAAALLLKETLKQQKYEECCNTLAELGVYNLTPSQASVILDQRNDLNV